MIKKNKIGLAPGTLVHMGEVKEDVLSVDLIRYGKDEIEEKENLHISKLGNENKTDNHWINVTGLHDVEKIKAICDTYQIHPLLQEDIVNTYHLPKSEIYDGYMFFTLKMISINNETKKIDREQISIVMGDNWLITFQEKKGDVFEILRERIKKNIGVIRSEGVDFLFYRLIDVVVDYYFVVSNFINEKIEELEEKVIQEPDEKNILEIQTLKHMLIQLRKDISPLREALSSVIKDKTHLLHDENRIYFTDVYQHLLHVSESLDTQREMISAVMEMHMSGLSNRMNQIMKVLTVMSTVFIPLTFISGIYGMNFEYMPELKWKYGYFGVWGIMISMIIVMLWLFKKRKWL